MILVASVAMDMCGQVLRTICIGGILEFGMISSVLTASLQSRVHVTWHASIALRVGVSNAEPATAELAEVM